VSDQELPTTQSGEEPKAEESLARWFGELAVLVVLAFVLAMGIKTFVVQPFIIPSGSMIPTLEINDRVLVNKFIYRFQKPARGSVVVFISPDSNSVDYIKRVIAVGGDTVDIKGGAVYVNGTELSEPYVHGKETRLGTVPMPVKVPAGYVWLMGDNRPDSQDARYFNVQPATKLLGRAFAIYWPLSRIQAL
jgi:signal peptidase I